MNARKNYVRKNDRCTRAYSCHRDRLDDRPTTVIAEFLGRDDVLVVRPPTIDPIHHLFIRHFLFHRLSPNIIIIDE